MATKIAINGLGRIGRAALKIAFENKDLDIVAVNDLSSADDLAYLLKNDSVYGHYNHEVTSKGNEALVIDDKPILTLSEKDPSKLPWKKLDVDLVLECTGIFKRKEDLEKHLEAGAKKVILSAPPKGNGIPLVVPGVNQSEDKIISTASCTTNCVAPIMEILNRRLGVKKAMLNTVHAFTSSQNLVDGPSKKRKRGRAAANNFVPTSTGAAKATTQVIPQLQGKFDGIAIRGPVASGSIADLVIVTEEKTGLEELHSILAEEMNSDRYEGIISFAGEDFVSSDILMNPHASIVDKDMTQVIGGDLIKLMCWYDNEWGYANQMIKQITALN